MTELQDKVLEILRTGKVGSEDSQMLSMRLSSELLNDLDECKEFLGCDRTAVIRLILQQGVKEILDLKDFSEITTPEDRKNKEDKK